MQFLNIGLPRSGLESVRQAAAILGVKTRPKSPFTHRDYLTRIEEIEYLAGAPHAADFQRSVATLQELGIPYRILYQFRPLDQWIASTKKHFLTPADDPEENSYRLATFGAIRFDSDKFVEAWFRRRDFAINDKNTTLLPMDRPDKEKWDILEKFFDKPRPFPRRNQSAPTVFDRIPNHRNYKQHEVVL